MTGKPVNLADYPLFGRIEDLTAAYGQTTDHKQARLLAWRTAVMRDRLLNGGKITLSRVF